MEDLRALEQLGNVLVLPNNNILILRSSDLCQIHSQDGKLVVTFDNGGQNILPTLPSKRSRRAKQNNSEQASPSPETVKNIEDLDTFVEEE